ncbi:MAG TPA: hypothetical protein VNL71_03405 [Chloroflexota bacterium]|nr:hypothetical protein [Chloroflexota bacterium]
MSLVVTPGQIAAGAQVTVTGKGYRPSEQVALELATSGANPGITQFATITADGAGALNNSGVTIPAGTQAGTYSIVAVGLTSNRTANAPLQVTAPTATLSANPTTFAPDDSVQVSGANFVPGEVVNIVLAATSGSGSVVLGQVNANSAGAFGPAKLQIPFGIPAGSLQLVATGQTSKRQATVAVTANVSAATLTVAPTSTKPGQIVVATGTHFQPGEAVTLDLVSLSSSVRVGNATASSAGDFTSGNLTIPANTPEGTVTLVATGSTSHLSATAQLSVGVLAATLTPSTGTVTAGAALNLTGTGFVSGESVTVVISGSHLPALTLATSLAGTNGDFQVSGLAIPSFLPAGSYTLAAFGQNSGRSAAATLAVQAPPPSAPILSILGITHTAGQTYILSPGGLVQVAGSHFPAGATVSVALANARGTIALGSLKTNAQGTLGPVALTLPANTATGAYTLEAVVSGSKVASIPVSVAILTPHLTVTSGELSANSTISVQGTGYAPGEQVVLALNSAALATTPSTVVANANGAFSAGFTVPGAITQGSNILTATGATSRAAASVTLQAAHLVATTWYFAHGDTTGNHRTVVSLLNPSQGEAKVTLTFLYGSASERSQTVMVPAHSELNVDLGLAAGQGRHVSTIVSSDRQIGAESTVYYGTGDGSSALGASAPAKLWYLAEGYTGGSFHEYLDVLNPSTHYANVDVRFLPFNGKPPKEVRFSVRPRANITIDAGQYMPAASISAIVSADQGIVVERTLRFGAGGQGAHDKIGIVSSSTVWLFAQGNTAADRQTFLTILNPNQAAAATVTATLFDGNGRPVGTRTIVVDPLHRGNIKINNIVSSADVAVTVSSSAPVVVERPQYIGSPDLGQALSGSDVFGRNGAGASWMFPRGNTASGNQETLYLYNPGLKTANVTATLYTGTGATFQQNLSLAPNSRTVFNLNQVSGLPAGPFGVVVRSTNGQLFIAEQSTLNQAAHRYTSTQGTAQ